MLAVAALLVGYASIFSLVLCLPVEALARVMPPNRPGRRTRHYLVALATPVAISLVATGWGLSRQLLHPLFSPHADRLRPHLCLRSLLDTPDGPFRARLFALVCAALVIAALASLVGGLVSAAWESRRLARQGRRREGPGWAQGVDLWEVEGGLASSRGLRPAVAVGRFLPQLFPGSQAEAILAHEVAHARRRDSLVGPLLSALVLLQGLSPAAWALHRRGRREREAACDRYAADQTSPQAIRQALATAQALTGALEEVSPLSSQERQTLAHLAWRTQVLESNDEAGVFLRGRGGWPPAAVAGLGALLLALLLLVPPLRDSLQCAAESLLAALGR
jgi:hypothetical protein